MALFKDGATAVAVGDTVAIVTHMRVVAIEPGVGNNKKLQLVAQTTPANLVVNSSDVYKNYLALDSAAGFAILPMFLPSVP